MVSLQTIYHYHFYVCMFGEKIGEKVESIEIHLVQTLVTLIFLRKHLNFVIFKISTHFQCLPLK